MSVPERFQFRGDIEGLRALAILLVIAFHVELPGWAGGFFGVDVFFVISGYLITSLLTRELEQSGRISLRSFYARRARRLLPASALMVVATLVAAGLLLTPLELERLAKTARATAAYVGNFYFIGESANYFAPDVKANALLHTWSLAVEEQFYLIWPAAFAVAFRLAPSRRSLAVACGAVTIPSLIAWAMVSEPWAFFGSPARAWEFGLGALVSLVPPGSPRRRRAGPIWVALGCAGFVAILASAHWFDGRSGLPRAQTLVPTLGAAALLVAGANAPHGWITRLLAIRPLQAIGRLSYGWYLWHWPILILAKLTTPAITLQGRLALALLALAICGASYLLLERPVRTLHYLVARPVTSLVGAAALTLASIACAVAARQVAIEAERAPEYRAIMDTVNEPSLLNPAGCLYPTNEIRECAFGVADSRTTIVLFGDSLAGQWAPAINAIAVARGWRLVTLLKAACSPADILTRNGRQDDCALWRGKAIRRIVELRPAIVVVSCSRLYPTYFGYEAWRDGFRRTLETLAQAKSRIVVLATTPMIGIEAPTRVLRAMRRGGDTSRCAGLRGTALDARFLEMERQAVTGVPGVQLDDLSDFFCDAVYCPAMKERVLVYLDGTHSSPAFLRTLTPALDRLLHAAVGG